MGYRDCDGTYTIALAVVLREYGLNVTFYTVPDPDLPEIEMQSYVRAWQLGVPIRKEIQLNALLAKINEHRLGIVSYDTDRFSPGHVSPLWAYRKIN